jgi:hypothetical protein
VAIGAERPALPPLRYFLAQQAEAGDAGLTVNAQNSAQLLPSEPDLERAPSVIVRDAVHGSTLPPPPSTRRRFRIQTLPGLGDGADEFRASLLPIAPDEFAAVDELLSQSLDSFEFSEA